MNLGEKQEDERKLKQPGVSVIPTEHCQLLPSGNASPLPILFEFLKKAANSDFPTYS